MEQCRRVNCYPYRTETLVRKALVDALATPCQPLSRVEQWLGLITLYLVLSAMLAGEFAAHQGPVDHFPTKVITRFA